MVTAKKRAKKTSETTDDVSPLAQAVLTPRSKVLVFISHDSRDHDVAEAFGNLLSDVSAGTLKSFRSSDRKGTSGLEFGAEWYAAIMSRLSDATDVVALFTENSVDRPWILYEAGVAKGKLDTTVFGVAMGVSLEKVSTGPFAQFQNCGDDEDSLTKLVMQLLQRNPDAAPREEAVRTQVKIFRENTGKLLTTHGKTKASAPETDNVAKLFEEVKAMVRELPEQVDDRLRTMSMKGGRRGRRAHPGMLEDFLFRSLEGERKEPFAGFLVAISILKDDLPWLFEVGLEVYRAANSGNSARFEKARATFFEMLKYTRNSKFIDRYLVGPEDEEIFFVFRHLPEVFERFLYTVKLPAPALVKRQTASAKKSE